MGWGGVRDASACWGLQPAVIWGPWAADLMVQTSPGVPGCPQHPSAVPSLPVAQLGRLERELSLPGAGLPGLVGAGLPGLAGGPRDHLVPALRMCPCETYLCLLLASPAHRRARQGIGLGSPGRAPSSPAAHSPLTGSPARPPCPPGKLVALQEVCPGKPLAFWPHANSAGCCVCVGVTAGAPLAQVCRDRAVVSFLGERWALLPVCPTFLLLELRAC